MSMRQVNTDNSWFDAGLMAFTPVVRFEWTDERVVRLKEMWAIPGILADAIAKEFGITRNAVLGKVHRLQLETHKAVTRKKITRSPSELRIRLNTPARKSGRLARIIEAPIHVPMCEPISFMELRNHSCRYAVNDDAPYMFLRGRYTRRAFVLWVPLLNRSHPAAASAKPRSTRTAPASHGKAAEVDGVVSESFLNGKIELHCGDMLAVLPTLAENSIDSVVCDPPYHLTSIVKRFANAKAESENYASKSHSGYMSRGFMGKQWDGGDIAFRVETWQAVYRVMKPGAHLIAFGGADRFTDTSPTRDERLDRQD